MKWDGGSNTNESPRVAKRLKFDGEEDLKYPPRKSVELVVEQELNAFTAENG